MSTIVTLNGGDVIATDRADLNTNFSNLNTDKIETSVLDTDTTLAANSDSKVATQKATKAYADSVAGANASTTAKGNVEIATAAQINAGTATGETGAPLAISPDQLKLTTNPTVQTFTAQSTTLGDTTSQFDITNPAGTTFRYTYDATGTNPGITSSTVPTGIVVLIESQVMSLANTGSFIVTGSGANYFEVTNASGVVESNQVLTNGYLKTITAQTYTKPTGLKYAVIEIQGAGAGGASVGANNNSGADGGGAGAYVKKLYSASSIGSTETLYVGVGGVSAAVGTARNYSGAISKFGSLLTALPGSSITGATASGGDININGGYGNKAIATSSGVGGQSLLGHGGASRANDGAGSAGIGYGSGGGGAFGDSSSSVAAGGAGAGAIIIVNEYYN